MRPCQGFSRIGVLIGSIIAIAVTGMLIVGISHMREVANLEQCRNNLRQIGLAICNYDASCGRLPCLADQGAGSPTARCLESSFAQIRPYVESSYDVYFSGKSAEGYHAHSSRVWSFETPKYSGNRHGGMANQAWRTFIDPGDATASDLRDVEIGLPDGTTGYYATGSYAVNGLVSWGKGALSAAFPRGAENSMLMSERPQVCHTARGAKVHNLWGLGFYSPQMPAFAALTPADLPATSSTGQVAPVEPLPDEQDPHRDANIQVRIGLSSAAPETPDFATPVQRIRANQPCDPRLPGGPHAAGLQCLMADASVRTFGWDTSPWIFWDACSPGNKQALNPE